MKTETITTVKHETVIYVCLDDLFPFHFSRKGFSSAPSFDCLVSEAIRQAEVNDLKVSRIVIKGNLGTVYGIPVVGES